MQFSIISAGPGHPGLLTEQARQAIIEADEVYTCGRVAGGLAALRADWKLCPAADAAELAADSTASRIAIAVSGDAGFFEDVGVLVRQLGARGSVTVYPGISSIQYLCAKMGESYDDVHWLAQDDLLAAVSFRTKVCVITDAVRTVGTVCDALHEAGLGHLRVITGARLGTGREQILDSTAAALRGMDFDAPVILLLLHPAATDPLRPVFDADLTTGEDAKMRQEVRWNAVHLLRIRPRDTVYDLGAGDGTRTVELARKAREGRVFAVDEQVPSLRLIARNREALGCYHVRIVQGQGAAAIAALPVPDAAFIGTGAGNLHDILAALKEKNERVRVVIAADTMERLCEAQAALSALRFKHVQVSELLLSRMRTLGSYHMMLASEPFFLLSAGKSTAEQRVIE